MTAYVALYVDVAHLIKDENPKFKLCDATVQKCKISTDIVVGNMRGKSRCELIYYSCEINRKQNKNITHTNKAVDRALYRLADADSILHAVPLKYACNVGQM